MSDLNNTVNSTVNNITNKDINSFIVGETYWFIVNDWAYNGIYTKKDRFLANNIILITIDNISWSVNINQVFKTKEECNEYAKKYYNEDYKTGEKELKFGPEYVKE